MAIIFSQMAADQGSGGGARAVYHIPASRGEGGPTAIAHGLGGAPSVVIRNIAEVTGAIVTLVAASVGACYVSIQQCILSAPGITQAQVAMLEMEFHSIIFPPAP